MSKIAVVTDSTAYIPDDLVKKHNITVAPQVLIWDDQTYRDGIDIQSAEFFARLSTSKTMATTSQVSIADMQTAFQGLVEQGYDVVGVFISSKLSGTIQSAMQAKELMKSAGEKVSIVNSNSTAMGMGFQALAVARAAEDGASLKECLDLAEQAHKNTGVFFAVNTLEFLHRGGRIGGAQRFLGTMLNMKPILAVQDGRVEGIERIRTRSKAHNRVLELIQENAKGKTPLRIATLHANASEQARALLDKAEEELNPTETVFTEASPVIANHAGPGMVGLAFMAGM
jgi:DegV family protein with EDD domain